MACKNDTKEDELSSELLLLLLVDKSNMLFLIIQFLILRFLFFLNDESESLDNKLYDCLNIHTIETSEQNFAMSSVCKMETTNAWVASSSMLAEGMCAPDLLLRILDVLDSFDCLLTTVNFLSKAFDSDCKLEETVKFKLSSSFLLFELFFITLSKFSFILPSLIKISSSSSKHNDFIISDTL
ncbi:hypothetical protein AGLY_006654 [Aphis glycines]|uniref:Uncharacterized protein n=1 Tax=Aphis glycines TaxID=307491 RepID=A0A6G0TU02_APHGL|nr:hypothetical protein AGLY_006654 [Aphis glycines]